MNVKKWVITLVASVIFAVVPTAASAQTTQEATIQDILIQIETLLDLVATLEVQLAELTAETESSAIVEPVVAEPAEQKGITIVSPNGGEQWEIGTLNTITWTPQEYNSGVNTPSDVSVYLEKKSDNYTINMGQVISVSKESFNTYLNVHDIKSFPLPGEYYVKVVNNVTGETDRSDELFTLLPRPVDLKVNGLEGPIFLSNRKKVTISWTSTGATKCTARQVGSAVDFSSPLIENLAASGNQYAYVWIDDGRNTNISMTCQNEDGTWTATDYVHVGGVDIPATLAVTSPNGVEKIKVNEEVTIGLKQEGLRSFSIALYKNDQWMKWIAKDILSEGDGDYAYDWVLGNDEARETSSGDVFKIYVIGQRTDGSGFVDDKSDAPFGFLAEPMPVSSVALDEKLVVNTLTPERVQSNVPRVRTQMASVIGVVELLLNNIKNGFLR